MNIGFNRVKLHLAPREVIRVYDPIGARVECHRGELWITQDRDFEDHFLSANGALTLDRGGLALIHAQKPRISSCSTNARPHRRGAGQRAAGKWFARTFGPDSIDRPHPGIGLGAL
jgi:hypothetical protein